MRYPKNIPILKRWYYDPLFNVYWGFIYNDVKKRFRDGTWIHTSSIPDKKDRDKKRGGVYIKTLNTTYILGPKRITRKVKG